jgi:hypothetical protein
MPPVKLTREEFERRYRSRFACAVKLSRGRKYQRPDEELDDPNPR